MLESAETLSIISAYGRYLSISNMNILIAPLIKCEHIKYNELPREIPSQFTCEEHGREIFSITNGATVYLLLKHINSHFWKLIESPTDSRDDYK